MKQIFIFLFALISAQAHARVEVLFHPHDPTLEKIGDWISQARESVDIAMYNMDVTNGSAVIQALRSPAVAQRLAKGSLKIRVIYEGYDTPEQNAELMKKLEELGLDARFLGRGVKMHHKFAVIDSDRVISGSANWSMGSYRNYNENILFFEREPEVFASFQQEFAGLWAAAKEFGRAGSYPAYGGDSAKDNPEIDIHFNSPRILKQANRRQIFLTGQVVRLIESAQSSVDIATTRIRLEPVLEAVHRAAARGVKVRILLSQDDYHDLYKRAQWLYQVPNLELRVKFYSLRVSDYMLYQMHNKFLIVDHQTVASGSFNWSKSGETNHIENLLEMRGATAREVLPDFEREFALIWDFGRGTLPGYLQFLEKTKNAGQTPRCGFKPISLTVDEVESLLKANRKCGS